MREGKPFVIKSHGAALAAIVPLAQYRLTQAIVRKLEDEENGSYTRAALADTDPKSWSSLGEIRKKLGLDRPTVKRVPVKRAIRSMVRTIVERFEPDRIILFGSHARGTAGPDSDVDLLVVMPVQGSKRDQVVKIRSALIGTEIDRFPMDLIVTTPEDFAWRKDVTGTIEYPAVHEGKVLYARK